MTRFIIRRLLLAIPTIILVTLFVFLLMELSPTDPAAVLAGDNPTPERIEELRVMLGLDRPFFTRYFEWGLAALQGDLGVSAVTHQSVLADLMFRLPITASLLILAMFFAAVMGIVFGTAAAVNKGGRIDWIMNGIANLLMAIPPFVAAVLLVLFLAIMVPMFPATGYANLTDGFGQWLLYMTLPAISLALIPGALLTRQVRGALVDALEEDYVRTARAKGLRSWTVVGKHAAKNAAVPVITVIGLVLTSMLGGAVVVERIFAIPGIGSLSVESVLNGDLITLQGLVLFVAVIVILVNLAVDASYGYFNPRLRTR